MEDIKKSDLLKNAPKPYIPSLLPINYLEELTNNPKLMKLLTTASLKLGEYRGYLCNLINPTLLISPLISQEAVLSSKLEGTHATLEDLLKFDANISSDIAKDELMEVSNYRSALYYALDNISTINEDNGKLPLTGRIIKEMHKLLLNNVRGESKNPGHFERQQNYIVSANGVVFTPLPANMVDDYMTNLEKYIHYEDFNELLQIAIIHSQFEMIHPFEDGNGRIGRLLIPLFLYYKELLPLPTFYMSSYFNNNRNLYLEALNSVSATGSLVQWFEYFLNGIIYSANESTIKAIQISNLYDEMKEKIINTLNSVHAIQILDFIFEHPIFKAKQLIENDSLNIPSKTVYNLLNKLIKDEILIDDGQIRNKTYFCMKLIRLL